MIKIHQDELKQIQGGGFSIGFGMAIGAFITFLSGVVDGFFRPLKCR